MTKVQKRVASGRLKDPAKIGAAVEHALQRHYGFRYYAWELKDGTLQITEHPVRLAQEKKYEGKYLLQTDQAEMTAAEAVEEYKQLTEVEGGFRSLKDRSPCVRFVIGPPAASWPSRGALKKR